MDALTVMIANFTVGAFVAVSVIKRCFARLRGGCPFGECFDLQGIPFDEFVRSETYSAELLPTGLAKTNCDERAAPLANLLIAAVELLLYGCRDVNVRIPMPEFVRDVVCWFLLDQCNHLRF